MGVSGPLLVLAPCLERPAPATLRKMEHEFSLKAELDRAWAVQPLALTPYRGRSTLLLEDPGGEPLDRTTGSTDGTRTLPAARHRPSRPPLAEAPAGRHPQEHQTRAHVLVNAPTGQVWLTGFGIASRLHRERAVARTTGVRRQERLPHGTRADRTHESFDRSRGAICIASASRSTRCSRARLPFTRVRSDGVGALPYRPTAGAARRAAGRTSRRRSRPSS